VVDISSTTRYYLLQSSTQATPAKPTASPPGGSWNDAEPAYTPGSTNSLYFVDRTVYSDGTWSYSSVSLSSSYEAAKQAYNKAANAEQTADAALASVEIITGTQTGATATWKGRASFASLHDGQSILYWLPFAGKSNVTLNLTLSNGTTTGAIPCYFSGTTRLGTQYAAGNQIRMVYRENVTIGTTTIERGWWAQSYTNSNTYDRIAYKASVTAAEEIAAGSLGVFNENGQLIKLSTAPFDITGPILYIGTAYTASALTQTNNYIAMGTAFSLANTKPGYSAGTAGVGRPVYIVGTLSGKLFTPDEEVFTTEIPTAENGRAYLLLGLMSTAVNAVLAAEHPVYMYHAGRFSTIGQMAYEASLSAEAAQQTADNAEATAVNVRNWMTFDEAGLHQGKDGSTYSTLMDEVGFHVLQLDEKIGSFARRQLAVEEVRVGKVAVAQTRCVLREAADGGMIITVEGLT